MLRFQYTEYLLSLAAIPVMLLLYFLLVRWKKSAVKNATKNANDKVKSPA